jgi:oligoribonuclease NrnB/cAMP/cGMP phosphodiesterase (DHH superfamily)
MRIVTRADFDGIVCATILYDVLDIKKPVKWIEPSEIQKGLANIRKGDVLANLPYHKNCSLWFDHHYTNSIKTPFNGSFKIAPSAAGVVYEYYKKELKNNYSELIKETDKIDSAQLTMDEVVYPEKNLYLLLSMTISSRDKSDEFYWNKLVDLIRKFNIEEVCEKTEVKKRCEDVIKQNKLFRNFLEKYTKLEKHVAITDFRSLDKLPNGNRFMAYSMFSEAMVSIKIRYDNNDKEKTIVSVGHSIFNRKCNVNIGLMLSQFHGGGHRGAGACSFHKSKSDEYIPKIIDILLKNENNE